MATIPLRLGIARSERLALCDLLEEKGPLAPTLCSGWVTSDLAAHLFVRENRPVAALGIVVPQLSALYRSRMDGAKRSLGYEGLVRKLRSGPPLPFRLVDDQVNTLELFVHHEDVRRAGDVVPPARTDPELDAVLWSRLRRAARFLVHGLEGAGLELVSPGRQVVTARAGEPTATLSGAPQELTLYLFGRKAAARVELDGPKEAVAAVQAASMRV